MKYKISKNNDSYYLIDIKSQTIINVSDKKDALINILNLLNNGTGFDGFTPLFFSRGIYTG